MTLEKYESHPELYWYVEKVFIYQDKLKKAL